MNRILTAAGLTVGYSKAAVVRDVELHVDEGEVVALLGANGAGKSTTMLALAGALPRMGGTVNFLGSAVAPARPHLCARRGLALVPESRALFTQLTVRENLRLGARKAGSTDEQVLDYFPELKPKLNTRAGLLSGGEQQMVVLGRALAGKPRLLLIDEMSLGLAPVIVKRLLGFLSIVTGTFGASVLLVEQQVAHALKVSDRAYVLSHGVIALSGRSDELLANRDELNNSYFGTAAAETELP